MSYYKNFSIVLTNPLFRRYIRKMYEKGIEDLKVLHYTPDFKKNNFTCLLCGVGNEGTADIFIRFVTARNEKAKINIIDVGIEQIRAVKRLVRNQYPNTDIRVIQTDALVLEKFFKKGSIDWIETDFIFSFFDKKSLEKLIFIWRTLLSNNGFITTRDIVTSGKIDEIIDRCKIYIGKVWLGMKLYSHSKNEVESLFYKGGFSFVEKSLPLPFLKRYSIIKRR